MQLNLKFSPKENVSIGDRVAINSWDKKLTKCEMLEKFSLTDFFSNLSWDNKLKKIEDIIKNTNEVKIQMMNLDIRSIKKSKEFKDIYDKLNEITENYTENILKNIAIVIKLPEKFNIGNNKKTQYNSFVFFTTIEIKKLQIPEINISINRIEMLEISYLEKSINSYWTGNLDFSISTEKEKYLSNKDPSLILELINSKKVKSRKSGQDIFNFQEWNDFIYSLSKFHNINNIDSEEDEIFVFKSLKTEGKEFDNVEIFVAHKRNIIYNNRIKNIFIVNQNNITIPIKVKEDSPFDLNEHINRMINDFDKRIQEHNNEVNQFKENLNDIKEKLIKLKDEKKFNENEIKKIKYSKLDSENIKIIEEKNDPLQKLINKEEESEFTNILKDLMEQINQYEKQKESYKYKLNHLEKEKLDTDRKIKNWENIKIYFDLTKTKFKKFSKLVIYSNYSDNKIKEELNIDKIDNIFLKRGRIKNLDWNINNKDIGKITLIKRYNNALKNIKSGFYKNPYLFFSTLNTPVISVNNEKLNNETINKYKLNEFQVKVVEKAINMRDILYLQGPPGTGKTQTICAIADEYVFNKNQRIVMTSSSHEAIDNFFDRLDLNNKKNPNLIILKYRYNSSEEKFGENDIYRLFIEKSYNSTQPNNNNDLRDNIKLYEEEWGSNTPSFFTKREKNIFLETFTENKRNEILNSKRFIEFKERLSKNEVDQRNLEQLKEFLDFFASSKKEQEKRQEKLWDEITKNDQKIIVDFDEINNSISKTKSNFQKLANNFYDHFLKNKLIKSKVNFLDFIVKNKLINIVGITTNARTSFEIQNKTIDLFSEYPIDLVIIDEISKSTTPEILARITLSKKVIFAGDYKQLPPITEFSEDECKDFFESDFFAEFIDSYKINNHQELYFSIKKIHETSFFKVQVEKIINNQQSDSSYQNLRIQHRFTKEIMECVNEFYKDNENQTLQMPNPIEKNFTKYKLAFKKINGDRSFDSDSPLQLIDTSYLSNNFINKLKNVGVRINNENLVSSFDSTYEIFSEGRETTATINEYNAEVIAHTINNLIKNNKNNNLQNKIGIICMTKNQKNVISRSIERIIHNDNLKKLNLDINTVDNFQGREKDIIIIDLVRSKDKFNKQQKKIIEMEKRNLSFYSVLERLNVAVSRAESKLIIVGSFKNHYLKSETVYKGKEKLEFFHNIKSHIPKKETINSWELSYEN